MGKKSDSRKHKRNGDFGIKQLSIRGHLQCCFTKSIRKEAPSLNCKEGAFYA
ncbi:hypothetical protein ACEF17_10375 [Streptococcus hyovaginalis]